MFAKIKVICVMALLIISPSLFAQYDDIPVTREEMLNRAEERYVNRTDLETYRYYNDHTVQKDNYVNGNIVCMRGDVQVYGEVEGDIVVLYGDIDIESRAEVGGDIVAIGGKISQDRYSNVYGNQIETSPKNIFKHASDDNHYFNYNNQFEYEYEYEHDPMYNSHKDQYSTLPLWRTDEEVIARYNRVQGLFLGLEFPKTIRGKNKYLSVYGFGGYGFREKRWNYLIGMDRYFFNQRDYRFELGGKFYDLTDTRDEWIITPLENSLSAFFLHQDFQDFYKRKGFEVYLSQNWTIYLKGTLAYRNDNYYSMQKNTNWALFYDKRSFRNNPQIDEGNMRSIYGEVYLDTRNDHEYPRRGWYGKLSMEMSNSGLNSDFYFNQYILELRHYLTLSRSERLDLRIKSGSAEGVLPYQKIFQLGGLSSLRGFDYKEFQGDRMLLMNAEYILNPSAFSYNVFFLDEIRLIIFGDAGLAWNAGPADNKWIEGFQYLKYNKIKSDIGIAFSDWKGHVRLNIAKRTDTNKKPLVVSFRIAKPF